MFRHVSIGNTELWQATLEQWKADAMALGDEGVFLTHDVEQRLNGLKQQTERENNLHGYFIVKNGDIFASSILEVSHALPRSNKPWLKLLNITIRPSLLPVGDRATDILKDAFTTLVFSITHSIELIFHEHPSKELKIFGRTPEMVNLFKAVISAGVLDTSLDSVQLSAKLEGSWLVLAKTDQEN